MTIAKDTTSDEIIHGHDLRGMNDIYIQETAFECPYDRCKIKATPCSFKEINLNQSHFRYDEDHKEGCGIHDPKYKNRHVAGGEKKHNSPPAPAISLLRLDAIERVQSERILRVSKKTGTEEKIDSKRREHPVSSSSIKPVVDYYINGDNFYEPLSIPPYGTRSYKDTFQLIFYREGIRYFKPAIYFGRVQSNTRLECESERYYLNFLARNKKTKQVFKLEIDVSGWNESKKDFFCKEYDKKRLEASEYYNGLKNKTKANKFLTVFFFGIPDENDKFLFRASYFKLIYIAFLDKFDGAYNNTNYYIDSELSLAPELNNENYQDEAIGYGYFDAKDVMDSTEFGNII
ncbi:TPA: hypothetical protein ACSTJY_005354, partial [Serratia fonticola]